MPTYSPTAFDSYCWTFLQMCPREDVDYQDIQIQELKTDITEMKNELADVFKNLIRTNEGVVRHDEKSQLAGFREDRTLHEMKIELGELRSELSEVRSSLDAILARLGGKH